MSIATNRRKALIASLTGSSIEWFDFFLYGSASALVFNKVFFSNLDKTTGLMLSYLTFSLTFFIRPFGGVIFAHIGDRIGRKKTLVTTLCLMGSATVAIGLLPGYDSIGIAAPLLLILCRIVQGIGIGGEWGGALLLAYEYAPEGRRGFYGSVPQMGVTIGLLLASAFMGVMTYFMSDTAFEAWGWRVPFISSIVLVVIGLWIRKGLDETPDFQKAKDTGQVAKMPLIETLTRHPVAVIQAAGLKSAETASFYVFSVLVVSYATGTVGYDKTTALFAVMAGALVSCFCIPRCGRLSDKIGRPKTYIIGIVSMGILMPVYFLLINLHATWAIVTASVLLFGVCWSLATATLGTLSSEIFDTRVRYTGITLGYQLGACFAGGTAPFVGTWLLKEFPGSWYLVALYVIGFVLLSLIAIRSIIVGRKRQLQKAVNADSAETSSVI